MSQESEPNTLRRPNGQFAPGHSGNPKGRPTSASSALRERLANDGEKVAEVVLEKALLLHQIHLLEVLLLPLRNLLEQGVIEIAVEGIRTSRFRSILGIILAVNGRRSQQSSEDLLASDLATVDGLGKISVRVGHQRLFTRGDGALKSESL